VADDQQAVPLPLHGKKRAQLLESFGATVVIERSSKITWPDAEGDRADPNEETPRWNVS
jgi:hypothetical protein